MDTNKKKMYISTILILAIIVLILVYFIRFGKIKTFDGNPTGNVDIYDITVPTKKPDLPVINPDKNPTVDIEPTPNPVNPNQGNDKEPEDVIKPFDPEEDEEITGEIFVDDKNGNYVYQQKLKVFENPAYEYTNKIAPGSQNTYQFIVHNSSEMNLRYRVEMYDQSQYKVNLKYRLKRNGEYVLGSDNSWVTANELITEFSRINSGKSDKYSLDWKWFDDDYNDTIAGKNMTDLYKLYIRFYFEEVE